MEINIKRFQKLAGIINENKEELYADENIGKHPEAKHIIDGKDQHILANYFEELDNENIPNLVGKTLLKASKLIGDPELWEENLQHLIYALNPDKYDPIYENNSLLNKNQESTEVDEAGLNEFLSENSEVIKENSTEEAYDAGYRAGYKVGYNDGKNGKPSSD